MKRSKKYRNSFMPKDQTSCIAQHLSSSDLLGARRRASRRDQGRHHQPRLHPDFQTRGPGVLNGFRSYLAKACHDCCRVAAHGAAGKGNTYLNVVGVTVANIEVVGDLKQGRPLPGSRIPIVSPQGPPARKPDDVVLPWNLADEIAHDLAAVEIWGGHLSVGCRRSANSEATLDH
jgi:hypothetical protein